MSALIHPLTRTRRKRRRHNPHPILRLRIRPIPAIGAFFIFRKRLVVGQNRTIAARSTQPRIVIDGSQALFTLLSRRQVGILFLLTEPLHGRSADRTRFITHPQPTHPVPIHQPKRQHRQRHQHRQNPIHRRRGGHFLITGIISQPIRLLPHKSIKSKQKHQQTQCQIQKHNISYRIFLRLSLGQTRLLHIHANFIGNHRIRQNLGNPLHPAQNPRTVISFPHMRYNILLNDAHTNGIRQHTLQAIPRLNTHLTLIIHHQQQQTIILLRLTNLPMIEQLRRKTLHIPLPNRRQSNHKNFGSRLRLILLQQPIHLRLTHIVQ